MNRMYRKWLCELTGTPTAPGREDRVMAWVAGWVKVRPRVRVRRDRYGNMLLSVNGGRAIRGGVASGGGGGGLVIEAHLDHPAFVVKRVVDKTTVVADFRGYVLAEYFEVGTKVRWHGEEGKSQVGAIAAIKAAGKRRLDHEVRVRFARAVDARAGDVMTWSLPDPRIAGGRLRAPACDNLAGVAAALAALDVLACGGAPAAGARRSKAHTLTPALSLKGEGAGITGRGLRVLLTRAEEVGLVGAVGACRSKILPKGSQIVVLEMSKSFADSPIGGGPIVRVGDKASVFDPEVTGSLAERAAQLSKTRRGFNWQRKLMVGGICNATAYQVHGYRAGCLCLPLGNYHNMNQESGKIRSEMISVGDWDNLVRLLVDLGGMSAARGGGRKGGADLRARLGEGFERRRGLVT